MAYVSPQVLSHSLKTSSFSHPIKFRSNQDLLHSSKLRFSIIKCSTMPNKDSDSQTPKLEQSTTAEIERRKRVELLREMRARELQKPDPPNFEIGWERTKEINLEKTKGYVIADFLEKLEGLMGREFGSTDLLAKAGGIVAERAREEAEVLKEEGEVDPRLVTELFRVLRLMEMDLEMVKASVKEETLKERLEQAKTRCRQAILVANSF